MLYTAATRYMNSQEQLFVNSISMKHGTASMAAQLCTRATSEWIMQTQQSYSAFKSALQVVKSIHPQTLSFLRLLWHFPTDSQHLFNVSHSSETTRVVRSPYVEVQRDTRAFTSQSLRRGETREFRRRTAVYSRCMHAFCSTHAPSVHATVQSQLLPWNFWNRKFSEQRWAWRAWSFRVTGATDWKGYLKKQYHSSWLYRLYRCWFSCDFCYVMFNISVSI